MIERTSVEWYHEVVICVVTVGIGVLMACGGVWFVGALMDSFVP